jgi:hypothetical protein
MIVLDDDCRNSPTRLALHLQRSRKELMSTRTFNADYRRGVRKVKRGSERSDYTVARLINNLEHVKALKAIGDTRFGAVMCAEQHVKSAAVSARMRILNFAFAALGAVQYPARGQKRAKGGN